jgi:NAD(P)-dependent dehydrogenase (short-subunit alcohol dehydrogenase family)
MNISLKGKSILVTGGTGVLGKTIVLKLLHEGAKVFFTYHTNKELASELETQGATSFQLDLTDREQIRGLKEKVKTHVPNLDGLVNNAATLFDKTLAKLPSEEWDRVLEVNLTGIFLTTKTLLPILYKSDRAKVVNLTSRVGVKGEFGQSNYAAAKAGVIAFTKSLAYEVGRKGISVNALNPGFMRSGMNEGLPREILEAKLNESVLNDYSDPDRVADFCLFLLSSRADCVSGQVFHVDSRIV